MTQLIGVLCEDRAKVILVSDRMVTTSDGSLAFEHEPKYAMVASNAIILTAGSIHEPELIEDAKAKIGERAPVRKIADDIAESYRNIRKKRMEQVVLEPFGIASFDDFYDKQQRLHEDTNLQLLKRIEEFELRVGLLLGGVDTKGHLYYIDDPGTRMSYDVLGFCCLGSGDRHAEPVFAFRNFSPSLQAAGAIQIAYEAKKSAEMAGGVGRETDIWIITQEACYEVKPETIQQLQESYKTRDRSEFNQQIKIKTKRLEYKRDQA